MAGKSVRVSTIFKAGLAAAGLLAGSGLGLLAAAGTSVLGFAVGAAAGAGASVLAFGAGVAAGVAGLASTAEGFAASRLAAVALGAFSTTGLAGFTGLSCCAALAVAVSFGLAGGVDGAAALLSFLAG